MAKALLLMNLIVTLFMTGVIWYVQIAHYPLFSQVGRDSFPAYHAAHNAATTAVVLLPMVFELVVASLLLLFRPDHISFASALIGLGLVGMIWLATFFLSVPLHGELSAGGYDRAAIDRLVATNWVRTVGWTLRSIGLSIAVYQLMSH